MPMKGPCLCVGQCQQWEKQSWGNVASAGSALSGLRVTGSFPYPSPRLGAQDIALTSSCQGGSQALNLDGQLCSASIHSVPPSESSLGSGLSQHPI